MVIQFGGLASGLDTSAIINALMDVEREPIKRLENEKAFLSSRLDAFSQFEAKLDALSSSIDEMDDVNSFRSYSTRSGSDDFFSMSVSSASLASPGNYQLEVVNLAQVRKDVSEIGYADSTANVFSKGKIFIDDTTISISKNSSLNDIRDAINEANTASDTGVTASTIYDGTNYLLVLTGKDADTNFEVSASGLKVDGVGLDFRNTQPAELAEIVLDGIAVTSSNNRIENAIPGVSIDLLKENNIGEATTISVEKDLTEISAKLETFATAYNEINTFISAQQDASWGNDPSFRIVKRSLQNLLSTDVGGTGTFNHLVEIGFKSDSKTGNLSIDSSKLNEALTADFDSVETLMIGDGATTGILDKYDSYLDDWTNIFNGLYAGKKQSYDSSVRSLDLSIERMELRLEKREQTLLLQFSAMEELVNSMNAASSYMTQQLSSMPSIGAN